MKLNILQRVAYKLGVPLFVLNGFAHEYYGYAIPNADGKYPDWWYLEQNVPTTFRDLEVPKEILKRSRPKERPGLLPRVYVRVERGQITEVVANAGVESMPGRYHGTFYERSGTESSEVTPNTVYSQHHYETRRPNEETDYDVDELVREIYVPAADGDYQPLLNRSPSVPVFRSHHREDDIMSFIQEETTSPTRHPTHSPQATNFATGSHHQDPAAQIRHLRRNATMPPQRQNNNSFQIPVQPVNHSHSEQRQRDSVTSNNTIPGYYFNAGADGGGNGYGQHIDRRTRMETVEEDYGDGYVIADDGIWEVSTELGRNVDLRRTAEDTLREYRRERS